MTRQEIIIDAIRRRHAEVCKSVAQPAEAAVGEMTPFVLKLRQQLLACSQGVGAWTTPKSWFASRGESLAAIRALAANEELECRDGEPPPDLSFFDDLQSSIRDPQRRFDLLTARYLYPLNIAAPSEEKVREHLLERLMVTDRARIEQHSVDLVHADDLLLRLNLIAIYASLTDDLRYLDALNYYYELLPSAWYPKSPNSWLRVSFLNFYARALAVKLTHINSCV